MYLMKIATFSVFLELLTNGYPDSTCILAVVKEQMTLPLNVLQDFSCTFYMAMCIKNFLEGSVNNVELVYMRGKFVLM